MLWLARKPSNDRDWSPDNAVLPRVELGDDGAVTVRDVRCFRYRSTRDYDIAYEDRCYRLGALDRVDFFVAPFGGSVGPGGAGGKAHTFVSFGFAGEHLAVSIEVRRTKGERYHPVRGLFRAFEIMYVIGDERDVVGLRTAYTRSPVYRFMMNTQPVKMREMFLEIIARVNHLYEKPEFYNTLTNTCTTNLVHHVNAITPGRIPPSPRVLLPGYSARLLYRLGLIDTTLPFEEILAHARIDETAGGDPHRPDFSKRIREPPATAPDTR